MQLNLKRCLENCSGNFVAICEGDDYWLDSEKLNQQMVFLQNHNECSMCFNSVLLYLEKDGTSFQHIDQQTLSKEYLTTDDLIMVNYVGNFTCCMYRASVIRQLPEKLYEMRYADWLFNLCCSQVGPIGYLSKIMSVYRIHDQGSWSKMSVAQQNKKILRMITAYDSFFGYRYTKSFGSRKKQLTKETNRLYVNYLLDNSLVAKIFKKISRQLYKGITLLRSSSREKIIRPRNQFDQFLKKMESQVHKDNIAAQITLINNSGFFNEHWYLSQYPDVREAGIDPLRHYLLIGAFEGRDPSPDFSSNFYLNTYDDVKNEGINPLLHYLKYGKAEDRSISRHK